MLVVGALRLNDDCRKFRPFGTDDRTVRQTDVDVNRPNLACVPKVENRSTILHVLLNRDAAAKAERLLPMLNVYSAPQRLIHARRKT
jgi:hypothetical protein